MKFGQLVECKIRNTFLEKSYAKCSERASPWSIYKKLKLSMSLDQRFVFMYLQVDIYQNILKLRCWLVPFNLNEAFLKPKRGLKLVFLRHSCMIFGREIFLVLCFINWPNFIAWLPLLLEIYVYCNYLLSGQLLVELWS